MKQQKSRHHGRAIVALAVVALLAGGIAGQAVADQASEPPHRPITPSLTGRTSWVGDYLAGRFAERTKDYGAGAEYLDRALAANPGDPVLMFQTLRMRLAAGRFTESAQLAPRVASALPNDAIAPLVMVVERAVHKDYAGAEKALARLPADPRMGFLRPFLLAWIKAGERDFSAAQASLEAGAPVRPGGKASAIYLLHSGLIDELAGKKDDALRKLRQSYASPDSASLRTAMILASFYRRNGKPDDAKALMKEIYSKSPELAPFSALENDKFSRLTTVQDGMSEVLFDVFGALASGTSNNDNLDDIAVIFGRLTLELRPDYDLAKLLLGDIFDQEQHPREALAVYKSVDKSSPLYWRARLKTAAALDEVGQTKEAVELLTAMVGEQPDRIDAAQTLGDLYRGKEQFAAAAKAYDTAVARVAIPDRQNWTLYYARGIAKERTQQWDQAEADFRKALQLEPDQPFVLNYLGYSWIDRGVNLREGKDMLERAVRQRPNDGAIVDSLAWAHYKLGEYPRAVELLERAVGLDSTDWTINDHLGDAYWRVGRRVEARFQWQRALALKPDADKIKGIEQKIENGLPAPDAKTKNKDG